jgi:hypothetical protein
VASLGVGSASGARGVAVAAAISEEEDFLLRRFLGTVQMNDSVAFSSLTTTQTASLLYRSGNKRAAKELMCDQPEVYAAFKGTASPCLSRTNSELRRSYQAVANAQPSLANAQPSLASAPPPAFRKDAFRSQADCLTAAHNSGVPLSACSGR